MKDLIMKKFKVTSEEYDIIFEKQLKFLKEKFPSGNIENLTKMATNTVKTVIIRNKMLGRQEEELLILGLQESPRFNKMRIYKANKNIRDHGVDKGSDINIKEKLVNEKGEFIDNFNGVIDESNPNAKDIHIVHAVDLENNLKVLSMNEKFFNEIKIGNIYLIDYQKSRSTKAYFNQPLFLINNISEVKEHYEQPTTKNVNKAILELTNKQILPNIKTINLESDFDESLLRQYVAIKVNILDLKENSWNTELTCLLSDDDSSFSPINVSISNPLKELVIGEYITKENQKYLELYIIGWYDGMRSNRDNNMTHYVRGEIICIDERFLENKEKIEKIEKVEIKEVGEIDFE